MSALGQMRTSELVQSMSALPPIADIRRYDWNVRFVPKADIRVDCSIRKEEPPGRCPRVRCSNAVRRVSGIAQPDAHDVEVGTATPVKQETSIALSVRCQKPIETYRQPFCTRT